MKSYQAEFLQFVIDNDILRFGEFTLKSGRVSPYFFNAGLFNSGQKLAFLARCYAAAIADAKQQYDVLFGPAYKGIPLVAATAMALAQDQAIDKPFCFNRKEAKDHGEGGLIVGAALSGAVMIVDDVITAGTAVREAVDIIAGANARLVGITVALDRQERGSGELSAIQEIERQYQIDVINIINLQDIIDYLESGAADSPGGGAENELQRHCEAVQAYREQYGV